MPHSSFTTSAEWMRALEARLITPGGEYAVRAQSLEVALVLRVAAADAEHASASGVVGSAHGVVAVELRVTVGIVMRARLVLVELGFEVITEPRAFDGRTVRHLQLPRGTATTNDGHVGDI